ncbi:MAG: type II toxin-antitoxin system RelE/ParE family toxin [Gammaproteobacteria bacterium]|nr:type II toxin-antitoxin system RelE/ParE family toxin [Gammaproteobacteria bacterium]
MVELIWTEAALRDIEDIADYIALDKPRAAKAFVRRVFEVVDHLGLFPESGRVPPELPEFSYREVICSPCRIIYKMTDQKIAILFVMRSEQDLRRLMMRSSLDH